MGLRVNPNWLIDIQENYKHTGKVDITVSYSHAAAALIEWLSKYNILFKIYNLGAGVKRITTETEVCPCCKQKI